MNIKYINQQVQAVKYNKIRIMLSVTATCSGTGVPSSKAKEQKSNPPVQVLVALTGIARTLQILKYLT